MEGAVLALRIGVVLCAFAVHSACVDPDRMLRLLRPIARHSALTATLITRMVPLAAADHARLREAQSLRGPGAAPVGRAALARRLVAGSLDRAVDIAATLELRGYARGVPRRASRRRALAPRLALRAAGLAYRRLRSPRGSRASVTSTRIRLIELDADAATIALAAVLPALAAAPVRRPREAEPRCAEPIVRDGRLHVLVPGRRHAGAARTSTSRSPTASW